MQSGVKWSTIQHRMRDVKRFEKWHERSDEQLSLVQKPSSKNGLKLGLKNGLGTYAKTHPTMQNKL